MGTNIGLTASDGHHLSAYEAEPRGKPIGGIVVIQEIFGVTRHIRDVADQYAAAGYVALAPALFDRVERDVDVPYSDVQKGIEYMQAMNIDAVMLDLGAAVERVRSAGKVGVVGYCWGGTLSFLAAARLPIDAAIAYYGGGIGPDEPSFGRPILIGRGGEIEDLVAGAESDLEDRDGTGV